MSARDRLIVAVDTDADGARRLARSLKGHVRWLKVGMTLFYGSGPAIVEELKADGFDLFVDLKLHDIPHQVEGAARTLAGLGVQMLTVHAGGGEQMMRAAVDGVRAGAGGQSERPAVLAVTVLTSMSAPGLASVGVARPAGEQVALLAELAHSSGVDGIVCAPPEARAMRHLLGPDALVVTPGVRPAWAAADDQARIMDPAGALAAGASHLVIGRPITGATDPAQAAQRVLADMEETR